MGLRTARRVGALIAAVVVLGAAAVAVAATTRTRSTRVQSVTVGVDLRATRQEIDGFGTSERVWSDPHLSQSFPPPPIPASVQSQILTALYKRLGLTMVRDTLDGGIQASAGAPLNFTGKPDAQIAFAKQAKQYGLRVFFPSPVYIEGWMHEGDAGAYVNWAMQMLQHWRALGAEPPLYSPENEPQKDQNLSPQWMHDVVVQLGRQMRAAGLKTKLVIPDDENPLDAYRRAVAVLSDPAARQYVGVVAYHTYTWLPDYMIQMRQLATQYHLPLWMTEYEQLDYTSWPASLDWAKKMDFLLTQGGVNAVFYLWGFFGDWTGSASMIEMAFDNGQYRSFSYTPVYWITGQYSRYVRPGYVRVEATSSSGDLLVSAYTGPQRAIVVATNPTGSPVTATFKVVGGRLKGVVRPVQSTATEHWQSLGPLQPRNGIFSTTLPPQSVTTFVAIR